MRGLMMSKEKQKMETHEQEKFDAEYRQYITGKDSQDYELIEKPDAPFQVWHNGIFKIFKTTEGLYAAYVNGEHFSTRNSPGEAREACETWTRMREAWEAKLAELAAIEHEIKIEKLARATVYFLFIVAMPLLVLLSQWNLAASIIGGVIVYGPKTWATINYFWNKH
jgi:hypothetical protein